MIFEALQQQCSHFEVEIRAKLNRIFSETMWIKVTAAVTFHDKLQDANFGRKQCGSQWHVAYVTSELKSARSTKHCVNQDHVCSDILR